MAEPLVLPDPPDGTPAGPNLEADEQDQSFGELERVAKGKPESQFGSTISPAEPPDWLEAARLAMALLERTRDLRVMVLLGMARVNLHDMPGFATVLSTIRAHLDGMWDYVHPQLDPEDDNDPLQRSNSLVLLAEPARVLRPLRDMPLARLQKRRAVTWRDIAILSGQIEAEPGREKFGAAEIRDSFVGTDAAALATLTQALDSIVADLVAIPAVFEAKSGSSGPEFKDLLRLLRDIQKELARYAAEAADETVEAEPEADDDAPPEQGTAVAAPSRVQRTAVTIRSIAALGTRDDALAALALASAYFREHEPSSPVPLLIDRAVRLAPLPFLEILRDLAPDGLMQAQTVAGTPPE